MVGGRWRGHVGHRWHHCVRVVSIRRAVSRLSIRRRGHGGYHDRSRIGTKSPSMASVSARWPALSLLDNQQRSFGSLCRLAGQPNPDSHRRCECPRALRISRIPAVHARWVAHGAAVRQPLAATDRHAAENRRPRRDLVGRRRIFILGIRNGRAGIHRWRRGNEAAGLVRPFWHADGEYDASAGFNDPALSPDETMVAASRPEADTNRRSSGCSTFGVVSCPVFQLMPRIARCPCGRGMGRHSSLHQEGISIGRPPTDQEKQNYFSNPLKQSVLTTGLSMASTSFMQSGSEDELGHLAAAIVRRPPPETLPSERPPGSITDVSLQMAAGSPTRRASPGPPWRSMCSRFRSRTQALDFHGWRR